MITGLTKEVFVIAKEIKNNKPLMEIHSLTKIYPGILALNNVNLDINSYEVHGLIGKNGAGKTTLVSIISGVIASTKGEILIKGQKFKSISRIRAKKEGVDIITQEPEFIPEHTVAEFLFFPDYPKNKFGFIDRDKINKEARKILKALNFDIDIERKMSDLAISAQQLLIVIKSFYIEDAQIVILDESSASLSDKDSKILYEIIERKKNEGKAILFISHRIGEILKICDVVTVLRDGEVVKTEKTSGMDLDKISSLIVGEKFVSKIEKIDTGRKYKDKKYGRVFLEVNKISKVGCFKNVSFELRKGEILGLAGLRGSGRTEIMKALVGIAPPDYGEIKLLGEKKSYRSPSQAYKDGMVYLPEEREKEGIVDVLSVKDNLILLVLKKIVYKFANLINAKKETELVEELVNLFKIKTVSIEEQVRYLSGGNKQKVVFGKIFAAKPFVYLLDEPTKGVDISTKASLLDIISKTFVKSSGIILTSPGLAELMRICDRILVIFNGEIIKEVFSEDFDEKKLYSYIQGGIN